MKKRYITPCVITIICAATSEILLAASSVGIVCAFSVMWLYDTYWAKSSYEVNRDIRDKENNLK